MDKTDKTVCKLNNRVITCEKIGCDGKKWWRDDEEMTPEEMEKEGIKPKKNEIWIKNKPKNINYNMFGVCSIHGPTRLIHDSCKLNEYGSECFNNQINELNMYYLELNESNELFKTIFDKLRKKGMSENDANNLASTIIKGGYVNWENIIDKSTCNKSLMSYFV